MARIVVAFLGIVLLLAAAAGAATEVTSPRTSLLEPCDAEALKGLLCGRLSVPEDYDHPEGRQIDLAIVVGPAVEPRDGMPPLVHLAGGPGLAMTPLAPYLATEDGSALRKHRDVILLDHRGTGDSNPLRCPALEALSPLGPMYPLDLVRACREELAARADLSKYGTTEAARDLDRVREALGYETLDLDGLSYGTQLARRYMALFPDRVRAAVLIGTPALDGLSPLHHAANAHRAVELMLHGCQTDAACRSRYPDLRRNLAAVFETLANEPVTVEHHGRSFVLSRDTFAEALRSRLGTGTAFRTLPGVVEAAHRGDFEPFLRQLPKDSSMFAEGLYLSNVCREATSRIPESAVAPATAGTLFGDGRLAEQIAACRVWANGSAPESIFTPPAESGAAVLMLHGELDQVAPPGPARSECSAMRNCRFVEIPAMGHVPFDVAEWEGGACIGQITEAFWQRPDPAALDLGCVQEMQPPPFQ